MPAKRLLFAFFFGFALLCSGTCLFAQDAKSSAGERRTARVQATYLAHLVRFTHWDQNHLPAGNDAPQIVIVGDDDGGFVESLEFLLGQGGLKIEGKQAKLIYFDRSREAEARAMIRECCQLVYVLPSSSLTVREINTLTEKAVVFGSGKEFVTKEQGDVAFISSRNRVKLVVSEKYFKRTSPKLSSKLVNLKSVVEIIPNPSRVPEPG